MWYGKSGGGGVGSCKDVEGLSIERTIKMRDTLKKLREDYVKHLQQTCEHKAQAHGGFTMDGDLYLRQTCPLCEEMRVIRFSLNHKQIRRIQNIVSCLGFNPFSDRKSAWEPFRFTISSAKKTIRVWWVVKGVSLGERAFITVNVKLTRKQFKEIEDFCIKS